CFFYFRFLVATILVIIYLSSQTTQINHPENPETTPVCVNLAWGGIVGGFGGYRFDSGFSFGGCKGPEINRQATYTRRGQHAKYETAEINLTYVSSYQM